MDAAPGTHARGDRMCVMLTGMSVTFAGVANVFLMCC